MKAEKICVKKDNKGKQFLIFNTRQFSRIYPKGKMSMAAEYKNLILGPLLGFYTSLIKNKHGS